MTISITLTDAQAAALTRAVSEQSTPASPLTTDTLAAKLLVSACDSYAKTQADNDNAAMASNPRFMALATAVAAQPSKFDAVESAVLPILSAP